MTALASRIEGIRFIEGRSATLKGIQRPMRYAAVEPEAPLPPLPRLDDPSRHARKRRWYLAAAAALTLLLVAVIAEVRSSSSNQATASGDIPKSGVVRIAEVSDKTAVFSDSTHSTRSRRSRLWVWTALDYDRAGVVPGESQDRSRRCERGSHRLFEVSRRSARDRAGARVCDRWRRWQQQRSSDRPGGADHRP